MIKMDLYLNRLIERRRLSGYIKEHITNDGMWYVFLDRRTRCLH